jgi:hypothetical protein
VRRFAVLLGLAFALASGASAGGNRVDIVVARGGAIWAVGDFGTRAFDTRTGRTLYAPQPGSARYDLGVAIAGGAAFVASIANGYTDGRVTRIDLRTHATRVVWHRTNASAQYVAAGAGGVYVLVGAKSGYSVIRLSAAGTVERRWPIVDAGRLAADGSGCWVAADHRLLHIRPSGRVVEVLQSEGLEDVATGGGAAWFIAAGKLTRIDEHTGVVRAERAAGLQPIGANHELAVGAGFLWTTSMNGVQRRDLRTGRLQRTVRLGGVTDSVAVSGGAVWAATSGDELYRLDPRTLRVTLRVPLS